MTQKYVYKNLGSPLQVQKVYSYIENQCTNVQKQGQN